MHHGRRLCAVLGLIFTVGAGCDQRADLDSVDALHREVDARLRAAHVAHAVTVKLKDDGTLGEAAENEFPEELSFPVPQRCNTNPTLCCGYHCEIRADLKEQEGDLPRVEIDSLDSTGTKLGVTIRARIHTPYALPAVRYWLLGQVHCYVNINSTWSGWEHLKLYFELHFAKDEESGGMRASVENPSVTGMSAGDVYIYGDWLCNQASEADAANEMMTTFEQRLPGAIEDLLCQTCEADDECGAVATCQGGTCTLPSGRCQQGF